MSLVNSNYRESTATQSWYNQTFASIYDAELKPQTLGELIYRYGDGLSVTGILHMANRVIPVKSPNITIFEKGAPTRPVKVSIATSADASAGVTVTPATDDDSDDYLRAGLTIVIPKSFTNKDKDVELVLSYADSTWTGTPLVSGLQITTALSDEYVFVGASAFGYGTAQPDPMASGSYSYETKDRIIKDTSGVEGGQVYQERWEEIEMAGGRKGVLTQSLMEMDFRVDDQYDSALLIGDENANTTNLVATSVSGASQAIPSFNGLIAEMKSKGQELEWTTGFDIDKFRAVKVLLENVGITNRGVDFFVGTDLNSNIETEMLDFLNAYSPGHSLWDMVKGVGFNVKKLNINGVMFYINELGAFSNPNKFGLSNYGYRDMGLMLPQGDYAAQLQQNGIQENVRLPHLSIGYPANNGENRKRKFSIEPGVNGLEGMGSIVSNAYDGVKFYTIAHMVPIFTHMHQTILVEKDETSGVGA